MVKISELLKWKDWISLYDENNKPIVNEHGKSYKVWLRVLGDQDLQESFTLARIASAVLRKNLRNPETLDFKEKILPIREAEASECLEIVITSKSQNFTAEAIVNTERPDEVRLEEVAEDADAPTLEEQEKLDAANKEQDAEYRKAIEEYIEIRKAAIKAEWESKSLDELREQAEFEASNILAVGEFFNFLEREKCWRACYDDELCKIKSFSSKDEFLSSGSIIVQQLLEAYRKLELGPDEIKNWRKVDLGE